MCSTAPTTRASGWSLLYSFRKNFYQVDVSTRGCCNDRSPRHISSSSSSEISYPGWLWKYAVSFLILVIHQALEDAEFFELCPIFSPMLHVICLIFSTSEHYSSPARIIVLVQARIGGNSNRHVFLIGLCRRFVTCWSIMLADTSTLPPSSQSR